MFTHRRSFLWATQAGIAMAAMAVVLLTRLDAYAQPTSAADQRNPASRSIAAGPVVDWSEMANAFATSPNGMAHVIISLKQPDKTRAAMNWTREADRARLRREVRALQDAVLSELPPREFQLEYRFENIAGFSGHLSVEGLARLAAHSSVVNVKPVMILEAHLAQGIPLIHADTYRATYNGQNMAIAICDTGVDTSHPRLGGGGFPNAKVIGGYDTGDNDADPRPNATLGEAHGTACAGIAAGDTGTVGDYIGGVAYGAKLYAIKISTGNTGNATEAAMIAGWDWCVTHQNDNASYPIMVISTSFGGGRYTSTCDADSPAMTTAAANAVAAGITVLASSGNDGYCDSMGWPACITHAISVGAVYDANVGTGNWCVSGDSCHPDKQPTVGCPSGWYVPDPSAADKVTAYSNSASFLDIFASSNNAYTCDIVGVGGYDTGDYDLTFGGTSAACPYAAGAGAALQSAAKAITGNYLTPAQVRSLLATTGNLVTDTKVAITKPRVNLQAAIASLSGPVPTPTPTPSGCPGNVVSDPGFELGNTGSPWTVASTNFGSPLCTVADCGGSGGGTGPRSGTWWCWFGGTTVVEDGSAEQTITVPSGGATLKFYLEIPAAGTTGYMRVRVGGTQVFEVTQADAATYATYKLVEVDISAYPGSRNLRFESHNDAGAASLNFFVDDICVTGGGAATPTPTPPSTPTPTPTPPSTPTPTPPPSVTPTPTPVPHPADSNSNFSISISEITAYGAAWKNGNVWPTPPNPIPIGYVTNAGLIWKTGEIYYYDKNLTPPQCWVPGAGRPVRKP